MGQHPAVFESSHFSAISSLTICHRRIVRTSLAVHFKHRKPGKNRRACLIRIHTDDDGATRVAEGPGNTTWR
jgi:hypothetical protein